MSKTNSTDALANSSSESDGSSRNNEVDTHPVIRKVDKFLAKEIEKRGRFGRGSPMNRNAIMKSIKNLGKDKSFDINSLPEDYIEFLNHYGAIYGNGFGIIGPGCTNNSSKQADQMAARHRGFKHKFTIRGIKETYSQFCWLIANIDQGESFYLDLSEKGKSYIYSIASDPYSLPKCFAKDFLEFLDKFFEEYDKSWLTNAYLVYLGRMEEDDSDDSDYD